MQIPRILLVVFFSAILICSAYSNLPRYVYATEVEYLTDVNNVLTQDIVLAAISGLNHEYFCEESNGIGDFIIRYSDIYVMDTSQFLDASAKGQTRFPIPQGDGNLIGKNYPRIIGGVLGDAEYVAGTNQLMAGAEWASLIMDHCQDHIFNNAEDEAFKEWQFKIHERPKDIPVPKISQDVKNWAEKNARIANVISGTMSGIFTFVEFIIPLLIAYHAAVTAIATKSVQKAVGLAALETGGLIIYHFVKERVFKAAAAAVEKYTRIQTDPPDSNYNTLTSLIGGPEANLPSDNIDSQIKSLSLIVEKINDIEKEASLADGLVHSMERYQGASIDGNVPMAIIHAKQVNEFSTLLKDELISNSNTDNKIINAINTNNFLINITQVSEFQSFIEELKTGGLTNDEKIFIKNLGYKESQVTDLISKLISINSSPNMLKNSLNDLKQLFQQEISAKINFANVLDNYIHEIEAAINYLTTNTTDFNFDYIPVANSGGPYVTSVNNNITLDGSSSKSQVSKITEYAWDLDMDGKFDDSFVSNPSISFSYPLSGFIGLKVTNRDKWSDVSYSSIDVADTNYEPIITNFSPLSAIHNVTIGNSLAFSIQVADPDNDSLSINWLIDNKTSIFGSNSFEYMPSFNDIGIHFVTAKVSDLQTVNNTKMKTWVVVVQDVDNDGDKWNANIDCNEENPTINPGAKEIHYNGLDDDCNPTTLDNNTPPTIQNVTFETNQNQRTTIELPSNDVDDDVIDFAIIDGPVNGTLGNIVVTKETNYVGRATYIPNNNFHGIDHLIFIANDGKENSSVGRVDINVGINESPIAQNQDIEINEDSTIKITLQATNHDGHPLTFSIPSFDVGKNQGKTTFGILKDLKQTGPFIAEVTYSPIADYNSEIQNAQDYFVFEVRDGLSVPGFEEREKSSATVSINVKNVNDPPDTINQNVLTKTNTPVVIDLKGTDVENNIIVRDHFNHGLQFSIVEQPSHGILSDINQIIQVNRSPPLLDSTRDFVTYTPSNNFVGKDSFSFVVSDGLSSSPVGNITITVQDPNTVIQRTEFEDGDIIIGTSLSGFQWYDSEGNHIKDLQSNLGSWSGTGGAFDSEGNLYVTHFDPFSLTGVSKYAKNGNFIERWHDRNDFGCLPSGTPHTGYECMSPESIVIDKQDNIFVGGVARAVGDDEGGEFLTGDHRDDIRKFNSDGVLLDSFDVKVEDRGSDWMELDPNQCTMYYTSEDKNILRYDVCGDKQLSNFANTYGPGRIVETSQKVNYALRLLPTGEFLVASNNEIWKLDSQGSLIQKYDAPGENTWFALNINPDGKTFWSASIDSSIIYKFDIQTGKILNYFTTYQDGITGIIIKGEPILSSNDFAPIVFNQTGIINGNVPTLINLTGFDIANDPLTFNIIQGTNFGILSPISHISNNVSQVTYTANSNFDTDSFTFIANDGKLNSTNTGTITVMRNHSPIANDDNGLVTLQGIPINIYILTNDTDVDIGHPVLQDSIRLTKIDTSNTIGNVTINNDNTTIHYVPIAPQYIGQDSFNYTIVDRYGLEDTGQVSIEVLSSNNIPIAHNQSIFTMENTAKTIHLVANDADPSDSDKLVYLRTGGPQNGYLSGFNSTTGIAVYNPLKAFHGQDSFTFRVHDGKDRSNTAYVNITVNDDLINDRPQVTSERISANVAQQINVDVLANDKDPNGDLLTLTNFTGPFNGTAFLNPDQTITYQSDPDFNASDVLYYRVADSLNAYDIGQLIIDVKGNSLTQTIEVPDSVNVITKKNTPIDIRLLASSLIKRPLNFYIYDQPTDGTLNNFVITADDKANVTYTPNTGFAGDDSFKYVVTDPKSGTISNIGTIEIIIEDVITNNPPVAKDQQVSVDEDNSIQIQLNATDPDTDSNILTYQITTQSTSGQISDFDKDTGILTYKPYSDFSGQDSFTFKVHDNGDPKLDSNVAIVSVTVNPVNDAPVAVDDSIAVNEDASPAVMIPVLANDTDIDISYEGDSLSVSSLTSNPTHGSASISSDKQLIIYSPTSQYSGPDSLKYTVSDKDNVISNEATVSIRVNPVNDPPVAYDKRVQTDKETPLSIQLQGTDPDSGDSISSYIIVNQPSSGSISLFDSAAGTLTYTPNTGFVGDDSFTFKVVDSNNAQSENTGTVSITVKDVITPPPDTVPPGYTTPMSSSLCLNPSNENTKGTQNDDNLVGTAGKETINGFGGKDRINSCSGNDVVNGNSGNDGINGDVGNDKINGNEGNDYLLGGTGNDEIHGNEGNDILKGGDGEDELFGNEGDDILSGGTGADKFACGDGNDRIVDYNESQGDSKKGDCEIF